MNSNDKNLNENVEIDDWSDGEDEWDSDCDKVDETGDVQLGFVEPLDEEASNNILFYNNNWHDWDGGKVGGVPIWLDPKELPEPRRLRCGNCNDPMNFLLQIYCPQDEREKAFHRCIYVFICPKATCSKSQSSATALRCQFPKANPYYSIQPSIPESFEKLVANGRSCPKAWGVSICAICGGRSDSACARCRSIRYCSKYHQKLHWKAGHRNECKAVSSNDPKDKTTSSFPSAQNGNDIKKGLSLASGAGGFPPPKPKILSDDRVKLPGNLGLFTEYEIIVEDEIFDRVRRDEEDKKLMDRFMHLKVQLLDPDSNLNQRDLDRATGLSKLKGYQGKNDPLTMLFMARTRESNRQILRYERGGQPLWCSTKGLPRLSNNVDIPRCKICGEIRTFEFQIMPQLLHYLKVESKEGKEEDAQHPITMKNLDWGVLAVYTCPNSCGSGGGYREETVWRQPPIDEYILDEIQDFS